MNKFSVDIFQVFNHQTLETLYLADNVMLNGAESIGKGLAMNSVNYLRFSFLKSQHNWKSLQALKVLDLSNNGINDVYVKTISQGLAKNQVCFSLNKCYFDLTAISIIEQTLETLFLNENSFRIDGFTFIAVALRENNVCFDARIPIRIV